MDQQPEVYYLETIEQMRALADDLRQQIVDLIESEPMTVTQIGAALDIAPAKIHYHVRELERVGLVRLVETRERGGILEKYYRAVARGFLVSSELLRHAGPDELVAAGNDLMQSIAQGFVGAFARAVRRQPRRAFPDGADEAQGGAPRVEEPPARKSYALTSHHLWLTGEDFEQIERQVHELLRPYEVRRDTGDARQFTAVHMLYETSPSPDTTEDQAATTSPPVSRPAPGRGIQVELDDHAAAPSSYSRGSAQPRRSRTVAIGAFRYSRKDLEEILQAGEVLDLLILGVCTFDADVSADLADRAIIRFRHRGALHASPAVRAVLQRKT